MLVLMRERYLDGRTGCGCERRGRSRALRTAVVFEAGGFGDAADRERGGREGQQDGRAGEETSGVWSDPHRRRVARELQAGRRPER